jgi:hypothetical protein
MARFNRNIITDKDIVKLSSATTPAVMPKTLRTSPPSAMAVPRSGGPAGPAPGDVPVPSEDDYLTKLVKYVPLEVLGAYLSLAAVINSNLDKSHSAPWLGGLLLGTLLITIAYDRRVLGIVRNTQIAMSLVGLTIYVFAEGKSSWFATLGWYKPWYGSFALPIFAVLVAIIKLPPLPVAGTSQ